jgi:hypothetical protein
MRHLICTLDADDDEELFTTCKRRPRVATSSDGKSKTRRVEEIPTRPRAVATSTSTPFVAIAGNKDKAISSAQSQGGVPEYADISEYEKRRLNNIAENDAKLKLLGLGGGLFEGVSNATRKRERASREPRCPRLLPEEMKIWDLRKRKKHAVLDVGSDDDEGNEGNESDACAGCEVCGAVDGEPGVNDIIICDSCNVGCHLHCFNPPLLEVPEGEWHCWNCGGIHVPNQDPVGATPQKNSDAETEVQDGDVSYSDDASDVDTDATGSDEEREG